MGLKALPMPSSLNRYPPHIALPSSISPLKPNRASTRFARVSAKAAKGDEEEKDEKVENKKSKQSLFTSLTDALDFSQVRSSQDAEFLEEAREATQSGGKMNKEQYGALWRKIGGTYKDFFKSYVDVDGEYVEEGWVDKTCRICKKDTRGEPRQVDKLGRYAHVACLENPKSGNSFTKL